MPARFAALALGTALLAGCAGSPSPLDPKGTAAADIANLWWWSFGLGVIVFGTVVAILLIKIFRRQESAREAEPDAPSSTKWILIGGVVIPALILLAVDLPSLLVLNALSGASGASDPVIEVIGYQWWWEVRYPHQQVTTANEIHIPVGRPVRVTLRAVDVIHSFWVPQLHGKIVVFPDHPTSIVLEATQRGTYRGECAEFCGINHANMGFLVFADPPAQFDVWLQGQQQSAATPTDEQRKQGQRVFLNGKCVQCHTIRGTSAQGKGGPDLTHLASRTSIASNTYPNTRGFLGGWIIDAPNLKPEVKMPPNPMTGPDLEALLAYLESLQ